MKTLEELRTEIDLGMTVYPTSNHDVAVFFAEGMYIFARSWKTPAENVLRTWEHDRRGLITDSHGETVLVGGEFDEQGQHIGGGVLCDDGYKTLEALIADWPMITAQPVWSTMKTLDRLEYEIRERAGIEQEQKEIEKKQRWDI